MQHRFRQTADKIATKLKALQKTVFMRRQPLAQWELALLGQQAPYPAPFIEDWQTVPVGSVWGRWNENFLMKNTLTIPDDWQSAHSLALHLPLGDANDYFPHPEALITLNGEPFATVDTRHMTVLLPSRFCAPGQYALQLHGWTGLGGSLNGDLVPRLFMGECALVQINRPLEAFITLSQMALDTVKALDPNHPTYSALLNVLDDTFMILDTHEPIRESVAATLDAAAAHLKTSVKDVGHALPLEVYAVGHAHIDTAWLWTLAQTRQKVSRTFHTVLHLMDQYPDYHYAQSQPQLYEYFREQHPEAFEQIKARVAEGRWEPLGGMWIESDINLAGAESLIRQFVLGRRYFREQFGAEADSPILWLPDVFGFAASLPQIIAGAGIKYLFTIKPRWNEQNTLPHDTFWWQGIDGTRILTHMSTVPADGVERYPATYNADPTPQAMIGAWNKLQDKAAPPLMLMAYGWGDGGGGPTPQMLDRIALMADFPALPHIRPTRAIDFFTALEAAYKGKKLPVWFDEIYLETHRGTYTTQAMIKAGNAKLERLLHDVEFLAAFAAYDDPDYTYPRAGIDEAWRVVCLHQFHDILPGSSIAQVYADAREAYAATESTLLALRDAALQSLTRNMAGEVIAVNTASVFNQALMVWPSDGALFYPKGYLLPYSLQVMYEPMELDLIPVTASETHLENQVMRVEFNAAGDIVRI
ncbi:MAG: alpha-mannosidase, partial [Phototrophicaceae bacterium]